MGLENFHFDIRKTQVWNFTEPKSRRLTLFDSSIMQLSLGTARTLGSFRDEELWVVLEEIAADDDNLEAARGWTLCVRGAMDFRHARGRSYSKGKSELQNGEWDCFLKDPFNPGQKTSFSSTKKNLLQQIAVETVCNVTVCPAVVLVMARNTNRTFGSRLRRLPFVSSDSEWISKSAFRSFKIPRQSMLEREDRRENINFVSPLFNNNNNQTHEKNIQKALDSLIKSMKNNPRPC